MEDDSIRKSWYEMEKLFEPDYSGRNTALMNIAQVYALSILEANDKDRIERLGKKHLNLVANKMLKDKQFSIFLSHVINYERF